MKTMGFFILVRVPDNMNPATTGEEIRTSVGFGNPKVTPVFQLKYEPEAEPLPFQELLAHDGYPTHRELLAHDGYATHSHEVRQDHLGVHRKEWGDNV
jgi:hypothetical protein